MMRRSRRFTSRRTLLPKVSTQPSSWEEQGLPLRRSKTPSRGRECRGGGCLHDQEGQSDCLVRSHRASTSQARRLMMNAAAAGAAHGFGTAAAANLREKDDSWNPAIGGFLSGAIVGLRCEVHASKPGIHILNVAELVLCQ